MDTKEIQGSFIRVMNRFRQTAFHFPTGELTRGEFFTLAQVHDFTRDHPESKGMYVSELAARSRVSPPAVSRMLGGLERRGLIERYVDREDRRTTYIVLTPLGEAARSRVVEDLDAYTARIIRRMGEEDMKTLLALWNRLADIMSEERGDIVC